MSTKTAMKKQIFSTNDLPCWLNAQEIANYLGLGLTKTYELLHDQRCPKIVVGKRILVPRDRFLSYLDQCIEDSLKGKE